jgi:ribosomal protein L7/L12
MLIFSIFILIVVGAVIAAFLQNSNNNTENERQSNQLLSIPDFSPSVSFKAGTIGPGVAIDAKRSKFAITQPSMLPRVYDFSQLTAVDIVKDGISLQKTNRGSQAVGAAVGGLLLGPVGLLLGGLTGTKRSTEKLKRLSLKIYTNDLGRPMHEIIFFDHPSGIKPDSVLVKPMIDNMEQWYGRFQTILAASNSDAAVAQTMDASDWFQLTLLDDGGNKIAAIKILRELTGLGLTESKLLSESLPAMIAGPISQAEASDLENKFKLIGASVLIEPC